MPSRGRTKGGCSHDCRIGLAPYPGVLLYSLLYSLQCSTAQAHVKVLGRVNLTQEQANYSWHFFSFNRNKNKIHKPRGINHNHEQRTGGEKTKEYKYRHG